MLIEPRPERLIQRICDTLDRTVLANMKPSQEQRQLKAALWTLRDLARRLPRRADRLAQEIADMRQVIAQITAEQAMPAAPAMGPPADLEAIDMEDQHLALQAQLAALDAQAQAAAASGDTHAAHTQQALRALYARMLERDAS